MLAIVAILLIFGFAIHHKWKNAGSKKDKILRLAAVASKEDTEIAELQVVEAFNSKPLFSQVEKSNPQVEKRYYCAVCYCPTVTRCSQCKAVRYCSGKCQIMHWRQGHKDECRQLFVMNASKENGHGAESTSENQFEMHAKNQVTGSSDSTELLNRAGSASTSLPCLSSSSNQSETTFDASISEVLQTGNEIRSAKDAPEDINSDTYLTTSDFNHEELSRPPTLSSIVYSPNNMSCTKRIRKMPASRSDESFQLTRFKEKRTHDVVPSEEFLPAAIQLKNSQHRKSSSATRRANEAHLSDSKEVRPMFFSGSDNHQTSISEMTRSQKLSSSGGHWDDAARPCNTNEMRMSSVDSGDYQKISSRTKSHHLLPSDVEGTKKLSQPAHKGLKTSVWNFVQQHFSVSKQSNPYTSCNRKDSRGNNSQKAIFSPQLFRQLYCYDNMELQPFGLVNCGNSCYANAVLQCLAFTRPIASYLLQGFHSNTCCKTGWCFICEFEGLILKGQELRSPLSPIRILSQIQKIGSHLSHGREEDAHEFLRYVVDAMQSICLEEAGVAGPLAEDSTVIGLTFGGYLRSKIKCMKCSGRFEQYDRLMDLTVEIDGDIHSLEEALAQFTAYETLGADDKYKCSRCKSYEKAKKQLTVLEAPNILTIVLKRFRSGSLGKLKNRIRFPEVLNIGPFMSGTSDKCPIYSLFAVVVHLDMMNAAYSGHYISYVKNFQGDWFRIDDSRVIPVDLKTVLSEEAYILLYARHTPRILSMLRNSSLYSDGKKQQNMEAISSSNSGKKRNSKTKPSTSVQSTNSEMLYRWSERHHHPNDLSNNHILDSDRWKFHSMHGNLILDSSSDSSSIFSISDASSYSTDSTKDSSVEDLSDYIFGSSSYRP